jgi:hypothetical protein
VAGGRAGCQALYDDLATPARGSLGLGALRDLAFDAYCMQHPDTYCRSAKSYAAHLTRLCCGVEHGGEPKVYRAIHRWLNGAVALEKPEVLTERGRMTVADLQAAGSSEEKQRLARAWAQDVWQAYATQHALAREWIRLALGTHVEGKAKQIS